jgi:hypothetical protein
MGSCLKYGVSSFHRNNNWIAYILWAGVLITGVLAIENPGPSVLSGILQDLPKEVVQDDATRQNITKHWDFLLCGDPNSQHDADDALCAKKDREERRSIVTDEHRNTWFWGKICVMFLLLACIATPIVFTDEMKAGMKNAAGFIKEYFERRAQERTRIATVVQVAPGATPQGPQPQGAAQAQPAAAPPAQPAPTQGGSLLRDFLKFEAMDLSTELILGIIKKFFAGALHEHARRI